MTNNIGVMDKLINQQWTTEVVALRDDDGDECFRVFANGIITTPQFNSKGAANAYAELIVRGYRKPEFRS